MRSAITMSTYLLLDDVDDTCEIGSAQLIGIGHHWKVVTEFLQ